MSNTRNSAKSTGRGQRRKRRNRAPYISLLATHHHLTAQTFRGQIFAFFWTLLVVCGCLGLLGVILSTVSAQSTSRFDLWLVPISAGISSRNSQAGRGSRPGQGAPTGGNGPPSASYSRYSSDMQREASIADQQRRCHEAADREGLTIASEFEFSDSAVSGTKRERAGLNAMLQAAKERRFGCLFFYSISRLARESVITMPMLKELVYVHKVRFISITEGIDSSREGWEMTAAIFSVMAERFIKDLGLSVFRGQEGTVLAGYAVGDHCFGYTSIPIPGTETQRRGRNAKPQKMYVIDDETSIWVVRIFYWYAIEKRDIRWIARELNRVGAPKDHRATTKEWRHQYVLGILQRKKYIGIWPWGENKNERNPMTGSLRQETRPADETEKWTRQLPHLRLIDDETWNAAQKRLRENQERHRHRHNPDGTLKGSRPGDSANHPRRLLSGVIRCVCGASFIVGGRNGHYLVCPRYENGLCECKTQLHRERAEKLILDVVSKCILSHDVWKNAILEETIAKWQQQSQDEPEVTRRLQNQLSDIKRKIKRMLDELEEGEDPEIRQRLQERRGERESLEQQLSAIEHSPAMPAQAPTMGWLEQQLQDLADVLKSPTPAATFALRRLVGGAIVVREIREPGRKRFRLEGTVRIGMKTVMDALDLSWHRGSDESMDSAEHENSIDSVTPDTIDPINPHEVQRVIDFQAPAPIAVQAEKAKALADQGLQLKQVAAQLGCTRSRVTTLLQYWYKVHGLSAPDGRGRRSTLEQPPTESSLTEEQMEAAKRLWEEGLADIQIAARLGWSQAVAAEAVTRWFRTRFYQEPPDHQRRRQALMDQMVALYDEGVQTNEIARRFGVCGLMASRLLRERLSQLGRKMVDRRRRSDRGPQ